MAETSTAGSEATGADAKGAAPPTEEMTDRQLAEAVLARTVRPRVADVRRLAEAVLAKTPKKKGKGGTKKSAGKKAKAPKAARKLARIPGQKRKKA